MRKTNKILMIAPSWIGDMVIAQALFKLLKRRAPQTIIDVLAAEKLLPLIERMPEVTRSFLLPFAHGKLSLIKRYKFARRLRLENYDQAIVLPNSFKSALIPFWARIPRRTGWRGEMRYYLLNDIRILDKNKLPLLVERYLALGLDKDAALPKKRLYPKLQSSKKSLSKTLHSLNLESEKVNWQSQGFSKTLSLLLQPLHINFSKAAILAICPGAEYGPAKRWPQEYFAEIAKIKAQEGWQIWLLGSKKDREIAAMIQNATNGACLDLTGKTNLGEIVDLLSIAKIVISNDSGLMHIAAAVNRPLIVIYGSSSPQFTPPLSKSAKILTLNLPCSPCFKRKCPKGDMRCMYDLTPKIVLKAMDN